MDPRNPDVMLAGTHQRRRHVWTLINGGHGIGESTSRPTVARRGAKVTRACHGDMGRIGPPFRPTPNIIYATSRPQRRQGIFRSTDVGETWEKRSSYVAQPMYYGELFADPNERGPGVRDRRAQPDVARTADALAARGRANSTWTTT